LSLDSESLFKVFELEAKKGYLNNAVIGDWTIPVEME